MTHSPPYRPGDTARVLVLDPSTGGTVLAPAIVEHCDPTDLPRSPWRVTYRLDAAQTGWVLCDDAGEGDRILPAATSQVTLPRGRAPASAQTHQRGTQGAERETGRGGGLER